MASASGIIAVDPPAHIPPELVFQTGLIEGPEFLADPYAFMAAMPGRMPPIFFNVGRQNASWQATRYDDVMHILRRPEIFSTEETSPFPRDKDNWFYLIPLEIDPPDHRKYREILDPRLSPRAILRMEANIRERADALIDGFVDRREAEFTSDFGRPLPVSVFLDFMGLPQDMRDTFVTWAMNLIHGHDRAVAAQTMKDVCAYLQAQIDAKRAAPDDGAISAIVHTPVDGAPLPPRDAFGFTFFLFIAGLDTVFAVLNNIFLWLANNPARRREIIDRPDRIDAVVEELLRVFAVTFSGRTATRDYELGGVKLTKGDKITCLLPVANYDPDTFPDPTRVDFDRPRRPQLAFTAGPHSCMGAHLARMEIKVSIQAFLRRIPDFAVKPGTTIDYWPGGVIGPKALPLVW